MHADDFGSIARAKRTVVICGLAVVAICLGTLGWLATLIN